jgi:hypothetical protein
VGGQRQRTNVVDEHTREALTIAVDRRIVADAIVAVLDRLVAEAHLRCLSVSAYTFTCRLAYGLTCRSAEASAPVRLS